MVGARENQPLGDSAETRNHRQKLLWWTVGVTIAAAIVATGAIYLLYRTALSRQRSLLEETVQNQAQSIAAIAKTTDRETAVDALLAVDRFPREAGHMGAIALVEPQGDRIVWRAIGDRNSAESNSPLAQSSPLAAAMRQALAGKSGSIITRDERGMLMLTAYAPVPNVNMAIATQIELAQIRKPFTIVAAIALGIALTVLLVATRLFYTIAWEAIEQLELNKAQHRAILETAPDGIITISDRGRIHWLNSTALQLFGYTSSELLGQNLKLLMPWVAQQELEAYLTLYFPNRQTPPPTNGAYELVGQRKNGKTFPIELAIADVRLPNERMFTLFVRDITERKRAQEKLQENYNLLQAVTEGTADSIFVKDILGCYVTINSAGARMLHQSVEAIIGKDDIALLSPESAHQIVKNDRRILLEGETQILEEAIAPLAKPGEPVPETRTYLSTKSVYRSAQGYPIGVIGVARDISDRVKAETTLRETVQRLHVTSEQLREKNQQLEVTLRELQRTQTQLIQSEKMSSLGQLVAGIAHEINNPVNFISGNLGYVREYMQDLLSLLQLYQQQYGETEGAIAQQAEKIELEFLRDDLEKILGSMRVGTDRIREIVRSLRTFSRLDEAEMKPVDIHDGIESTLLILQGRLKATADRPPIEVVKEFGTLPLIECYAGQLNQVFMNVLTNAIDALEVRGEERGVRGEEVCTSTPNRWRPTIHIRTDIVHEDSVLIAIADNGCGMTEDVKNRLFDPFFTTKPVGKGTGLGLAISHQIIVQKHGGKLQYHSQPGRGTELSICIPIYQIKRGKIKP